MRVRGEGKGKGEGASVRVEDESQIRDMKFGRHLTWRCKGVCVRVCEEGGGRLTPLRTACF